MILPASLRRFQPPTEPPSEALPEPPSAAPPAPPAIGYVVTVTEGGTLRHLTNADLMDLDGATHEAQTWRQREGRGGKRFTVCAVVPLEGEFR